MIPLALSARMRGVLRASPYKVRKRPSVQTYFGRGFVIKDIDEFHDYCIMTDSVVCQIKK